MVLLLPGCWSLPKLNGAEYQLSRGGGKVSSWHRKAIAEGVNAMIAFRRADMAKQGAALPSACVSARGRLTDAMSKLQIGDHLSVPKGLESVYQAFECSLGAMDTIIQSTNSHDQDAADQGWHTFDAAAISLAEALEPRNRIGLSLTQVSPAAVALNHKVVGGLLVNAAAIGKPAWSAGIRRNDIIISFNGRRISDPEEFLDEVLDSTPGTKVNIEVIRSGRPRSFRIVIGRPR